MLHRTGPNTADDSRIAYVAEYMPLGDYDPYLAPLTSRASRISSAAFTTIDKEIVA